MNGLGKDAAYIISRINGFTYVKTQYDYATGKLAVVSEKAFSAAASAPRCAAMAATMSTKRGRHAP